MIEWLHDKKFCTRGVSVFWRGFIQIIPWIGQYLAWQIGNGKSIQVGVDPLIGNTHTYLLPEGLRSYLEDLDIISLAQARNTLPDAHCYWYSTDELLLEGEWKSAWNLYTRALELNGIRLSDAPDILMWDYNKKDGMVSASSAYDCLVHFYRPHLRITSLWNCTLPRKIGCFIWLV